MAGILQMDFAAASDIQRRLEEVLTGTIFSFRSHFITVSLTLMNNLDDLASFLKMKC